MKTENIPFISYVFIGVTSLVLTYATIADTTTEIDIPEYMEKDENESSIMPSLAVPEVPVAVQESIDKVKALNPFSEEKVDDSPEIPNAIPVNENKQTIGGKNKRRKSKKQIMPKNNKTKNNKTKNKKN